MTATPKWFARYKDDIEIIFSKIQILQVEFKNLTTKFLLETQKTIICDYVSLFVPIFHFLIHFQIVGLEESGERLPKRLPALR